MKTAIEESALNSSNGT